MPAGLAGHRDRDAAAADGELEQRAVRLTGELDVEGDVLRHVRRPVVVDRREGVVELTADAIVGRWTPRRSRTGTVRDRGGRRRRRALEELRLRYLGRKSELKLALRQVRDRETGIALNAARTGIEDALARREAELEAAAEAEQEPFDATPSPRRPRRRGSLHLITQLRRRIEDIFLGMGYEVYDGREVETVWHNFDASTTSPRRIPPAIRATPSI